MLRTAVFTYIGVALLYGVATAAYVAGVTEIPDLREPAGGAFALTFGLYTAFTILLASRIAAHVVRNGHSRAWMAGFFMIGGIAIPAYYFMRKPSSEETPASPRWAGAAITAYVILALAHASWTILIALTSVPMTRAYGVIAGTDTVATWVVWLMAIAAVTRLSWPPWRKLLWAIFILVLPFIAVPLRHYAFRA